MTTHTPSEQKHKLSFIHGGVMPFLAFLLFAGIFFAVSKTFHPFIGDINNAEIIEKFGKYAPFAGAGLGLLSMLLMYILYIFRRLFRLHKTKYSAPVILMLGFAPWLALGYDLVYLEPRYAMIVRAIISYGGQPMFYSSIVMAGLGILWLIINPFMKSKKTLIVTALVTSSLFLNGCVGNLMEIFCDLTGGDDHCYQAAAVQNADPYGCANIKGEGFTGSNPPKDKCYLMIAENTGDYNACNFIAGGPMSYTKEECVIGAAVKHEDPEGCELLKGNNFNTCKQQVGATITSDKLADINQQVEDAKSAAGRDPEDEDAKKYLAELVSKQKAMFDFAPDGVKGEFFKKEREEIMSDVEDEDVKSEIAKLFIDMRNKNPNMSLNDQLAKLKDLKENQEYVKNLDEQANQLMDNLKENVTGFANDTFDDLYGEDVEAYKEKMQEKGMKYLEEKLGAKTLKNGISQLEWIKSKYDKASEQYEKINEQIERLKKVYNEAEAVYKKYDEVNKLVAEGKIDPKRAKVLHGAIFLGKGLEYATDYVPVFGSTISTITKETFDATVKLATKRAERSNSLDKCFDDPEHCDTDNISGY